MLLRIEFGFILGTQYWEKTLGEDFFNELIKANKCFRENTNHFGSTAYFYYCNKNIDISKFKPFIFTINDFDYNFTLTKDDLFLDIGDKYIFLMGFYDPALILGYPFLKKNNNLHKRYNRK